MEYLSLIISLVALYFSLRKSKKQKPSMKDIRELKKKYDEYMYGVYK